MNKRQLTNAKVFRKLCRTDVYVDADSGVVLTSGPQERPNEVEYQPSSRLETIAKIGGLIIAASLVALLGFATVKKLKSADQKQDTYIQENFPKQPYNKK